MKSQQPIPITQWTEESYAPSIPVRLSKAKLSTTGAEFDEKMSYEKWLETGVEFAKISDCSQWWIGDWLVFGQKKFGEDRCARGAALEAFDGMPLATLMWVCESIERKRRREKLSWKHHHEVAALPESKQEELFNKAEMEKWSAKQLHDANGPTTRERSFLPERWISSGIDRLKAMAQGSRRKEIKEALRPLVELYNTL